MGASDSTKHEDATYGGDNKVIEGNRIENRERVDTQRMSVYGRTEKKGGGFVIWQSTKVGMSMNNDIKKR